MKESAIRIRQHNSLTEARYEITAMEKNIMYMAMCNLHQQIQEKTTGRLSFKISALESLSGSSMHILDLRKAVRRLSEREVALKSGASWKKFNIVTYARIFFGEIILEMTSQMEEVLKNLTSRFSAFELRSALSLKSLYSKRIYEMVSQYKDTGILSLSVLELKERLTLIDEKKAREKYEKWSRFSAKVLEVARREINEKTELRISYEPIKEGRKYTKIRFKIKDFSKQKGVKTPAKSEEQPTKSTQWSPTQVSLYQKLVRDPGYLSEHTSFAKKLVMNVNLNQLEASISWYSKRWQKSQDQKSSKAYFSILLNIVEEVLSHAKALNPSLGKELEQVSRATIEQETLKLVVNAESTISAIEQDSNLPALRQLLDNLGAKKLEYAVVAV